ncbi:EAL domain-containing protein [Oceanicoccus sagamiensis]|uniref:Ferrous iron transporter C n=1 Tax=Oceanicoccus sagamiensis TaxID=716816 RepID=A0A1X9N639_9GAMM|nr:EAL domain-containing protein [Oceanicoccus sagamiensis]ARN73558.1 hypothetical protein BST96_05150 [Oceanicoccus sagamiensis]
MARKSTIKLLLINESDNEGERLISLFRNAGRVARAQRASSAEDLHSLLEQENWDLLIANDKHPEIAVEQCLEHLKKQQSDIPCLIIRDSNADAALEAGASDVVSSDDDQRLIFAAFRELRHLETYRELYATKEKLSDAEERSEMLMSKSQDAIAYLSDGMLISSNPLFCQRFGYDDPDDLDCAPIIDLIDAGDQESFKNLLKTQISNGEGSTDFNFTGINQAGEGFSAAMRLNNAVFDEEPCIQLTIKEQGAESNSSSGGNPDIDPATGLYSYQYFLSQLETANQQATAGTQVSTLLYLGLDKFTSIRSRYGITHAYNILLDLAEFIQAKSDEANCLAHYCDDSFTLLMPNTGTEKAKQYALDLCQQISEHIVEVDGQSIQCTVSVGLVAIDGKSQQEANQLIDNAFSASEKLREDADNEGVGNGAELYIHVREKKALGDANGDDELDAFIQEAIEDERFTLTFQPVVSLRGTSGDHYEVRTTMTSDEGEALGPNQFLGNINFSSINTRLDRWILLEATKKLSAHTENGHDTRVIINLTNNALQDETLIPWLSVALKAGGIPPQALIFQFLEADITDFLKPAKTFAEAVKDLGCKISITNFGKVDEPFKALNHVGADYAKIASELTEALQSGGDTQEIKSMVTTINESSTQAIISGVENAAALAHLWQIGVDYIQGGYLAGQSGEMDYEFTDIA